MAQTVLGIAQDEFGELSIVDVAFHVLKNGNKPLYYRDLMAEVARLRGFKEDEVNEVIARLYTEINMDGRFLCVGGNVWGLKTWYPVDKTVEKASTGTAKRFVRKEADPYFDDDSDDDDFLAADDEEDEVVDEEVPDTDEAVEEEDFSEEEEFENEEEGEISFDELGESEAELEDDEEEN